MLIDLTCSVCGGTFSVKPYRADIARACSPVCANVNRRRSRPEPLISDDGATARIPLHDRLDRVFGYALVDAADAAWASQWRWFLTGRGYVTRFERTETRNRTVKMHRVLLGLANDDVRQGDHINRDRLDNRRGNLRIATNAQNEQNKSKRRNTVSRFRGVSLNNGRWRAKVTVSGKRIDLGHFSTEEEAGHAALEGRLRHLPYAVD